MPAHLKLQEILLRLSSQEFEDLLALALEKVLGRRIWCARSGFQFGADLGTGSTDEGLIVRLEAKRYNDGKTLKERELLGELEQARQKNSGLDLWILGTCTEVPEQIEAALVAAGFDRGIGIEIIDLSASSHSKLPRLLALAS